MLNILAFDGFSASGATQAAWVKGAAIKGYEFFIDQRPLTSSTGKAMRMPVGTQCFESIAMYRFVAAFAFHA